MTRVMTACALGGAYVLHRLGRDGRRFVVGLACDLITTRRNDPWPG